MVPWRQTGLVVLFALVAFPMWVAGGTQPAWQHPLPILAGVLLSITIKFARQQLWSDPVTSGGALFLLLLLVQWANSNRPLVFDPMLQAWIYGPPPVAWLPSSVSRPEAAEMLRWFFPAWVIALAARHLPTAHPSSRNRLLQSVVIAASLLAAGSMLQFAIATYWGIGRIPSESYFIASFGYANQAGSFFILCFCITLGNALSALLNRQSRPKQVTAGICCLLCLGGALVTLSRSAILMAMVSIVVCVVFLLLFHRPGGGRAARFDRVLIALATVIAVFLLFQPLFGRSVADELGRRSPQMDRHSLPANWTYSAIDSIRPLYRTIAVGILSDHPWFGAGGWAVRHLGMMYVPARLHPLLQTDGAANTHNDLLQFLSEFGFAGMTLLWGVIGIMVAPLARHFRAILLSPRIFFRLLGLLLVMIHSMVDLPFRSPAVLFLWTLTLALTGGFPPVTAIRKDGVAGQRTRDHGFA